MVPCSLLFRGMLKQVLSASPHYSAVITDHWIAAVATELAGGVAYRHTATSSRWAAMVTHGEPTAGRDALSFGRAPCNESQREAEC